MKIKFGKNNLSKILKGIGGLVEEVNIIANEKELSIRCMDLANVCLVIFKMPASEFANYEANEIKDEVIGVNLRELSKYISKFKENFTMEVLDNRLIIKDEKKLFKLPLLELENKETKIPELDFEGVKVEGSINSEIDNLLAIGDCIIFENKDKNFTISCEGILVEGKIVTETIAVGGDQKAKYSSEYLKKIIAMGDITKLEFKKDYPLKITLGKFLEIILAPRVEN